MTPEELKARLMAEAEAIVSELVGQQPHTLSEIEQAVVKAGMQFKAAMLTGVVAGGSAVSSDGICATCGGKLKDKGRRGKWVLTQAGEVRVERDYYYCERCKAGFFPWR